MTQKPNCSITTCLWHSACTCKIIAMQGFSNNITEENNDYKERFLQPLRQYKEIGPDSYRKEANN